MAKTRVGEIKVTSSDSSSELLSSELSAFFIAGGGAASYDNTRARQRLILHFLLWGPLTHSCT